MTKREMIQAHCRIVGKTVLTMRKELGLTTEGLSELSGIPLILLGRIETGIASGDEWGLREIAAIADALDRRHLREVSHVYLSEVTHLIS